MDGGHVLLGNLRIVRDPIHQIPAAIQKALAALNSLIGPGGGLFKVTDEHDIKPHGIRAVGLNNIIGIDHIAQ